MRFSGGRPALADAVGRRGPHRDVRGRQPRPKHAADGGGLPAAAGGVARAPRPRATHPALLHEGEGPREARRLLR